MHARILTIGNLLDLTIFPLSLVFPWYVRGVDHHKMLSNPAAFSHLGTSILVKDENVMKQ